MTRPSQQIDLHLAVLGHSFLARHQALQRPTKTYLHAHPDVKSYFVHGISGLLYSETHELLDAMKEFNYTPTSILLVLGDNDLTYKNGYPRRNMQIGAFPSAFHQSRVDAVALCEQLVGVGKVCSTVPYPRFTVRPRGGLLFKPNSPHNRLAGQYVKQLPIFRPGNDLPFVRQPQMVPYMRGNSIYPHKPNKTLFRRDDGIHPAVNSFDELFKPVLQEWIARIRC